MSYRPQQLSDREEIRDLAMRYCRGVDRLDPDVMKSAYWPDAVDDHGNFVGNAHEFVDYCMVAHLRWTWTMHSIFTHQIELDTWYGRYLDRYQKRGDEWRIIHRVCVHNGTETRAAAPMAMETAKYRDGSFDRPSGGRPIGP